MLICFLNSIWKKFINRRRSLFHSASQMLLAFAYVNNKLIKLKGNETTTNQANCLSFGGSIASLPCNGCDSLLNFKYVIWCFMQCNDEAAYAKCTAFKIFQGMQICRNNRNRSFITREKRKTVDLNHATTIIQFSHKPIL